MNMLKRLALNLLGLLATVLPITAQGQTIGWSMQNSPVTQNLRGIAFVDSNTWVTVGDAGTILRSSDAGARWTTITSPVVDALRGVAFLGNIGLAVGISGRVIRTIDGGMNWTETRPTTRNLYAVSISSSMAVATGDDGLILVSLDNGLTWTLHGAGTVSILFGVSVHDTTGVSVGAGGAAVMSINHGKGWGLNVLGGQLVFFYSVSFITNNVGWAVGSTSATTGNIIIHSIDNGFIWTGQSAPTPEQLFGVSFAAVDTGSAVGANGTIIHTSDGGTTWKIQNSGTIQNLNAVSFLNSKLGIAVGDSGTILKTTNEGVGSVSVLANRSSTALRHTIGILPNPATNFLTVNTDNAIHNSFSLTIYNSMGKAVSAQTLQKTPASLSIGNLSNGIYIVEITSNGYLERHKLTIRK